MTLKVEQDLLTPPIFLPRDRGVLEVSWMKELWLNRCLYLNPEHQVSQSPHHQAHFFLNLGGSAPPESCPLFHSCHLQARVGVTSSLVLHKHPTSFCLAWRKFVEGSASDAHTNRASKWKRPPQEGEGTSTLRTVPVFLFCTISVPLSFREISLGLQ